MTPLAMISLGNIVPQVRGIAFDAYDKLWIWTGEFAIPVQIHYDAYVWVPATRTIYATDKYFSLHMSNFSPSIIPGQWDFTDPDESGQIITY
jgi:hypothetical protein